MRLWEEAPRAKARIEIIPMIDVMMFLLVFFVLISINVIPATGVKTRLPVSSSVQDNRAVRNVIVNMPKDGGLQLDGRSVDAAQMTDALRAMKRADDKVQVIVKGDAEVELQRLLEVMDAVKAGGIDAISIAAKKKAG
jgi:biopolymer transport protein ExbD